MPCLLRFTQSVASPASPRKVSYLSSANPNSELDTGKCDVNADCNRLRFVVDAL